MRLWIALLLVVTGCAAGGGDPEEVAAAIEADVTAFLDNPNSGDAAALAESMGGSGDLRYGPWLLDMHRLARSSIVDDAAAAALAELSGIEPKGTRLADFQIYGSWAQSNPVDPGEGYREWKLTLYGRIDDEFVPLLDSIEDDQLLAEVHWGGVTRGGIPELNAPVRIEAAEADWMEPDELILGAVIDGVAVAYPVRILGRHEMANDEIAGVPVVVAYCTLCRTGLLFDRRVDGDVLDFQTSGLLWSSNKVMVDVQTNTLWQHLTGEGIAGPMSGVELVQYPLLTSTWSEWLADHPDTETLALPEPIIFDNPEQPPLRYDYTPGEAYRSYYEDPDVWFPILDTPEVFELKTPVIGLGDGDDALAVEVGALGEAGPTTFVVGGATVVLVPTDGGALAFDASATGLADGDRPILDSWDETAAVLDSGERLPRLVAPQSFWFAWYGLHPETRWWPS